MTKRYFAVILAVLWMMVLSAGGCDQAFKQGGPAEAPPPTRYVFDDIRVPGELEAKEKESFVFESSGFKAGTIIMRGYVDADSLKAFFETNMAKDGWHLKSTFRFPKTVLLFEKPEKVAIIEIYDKSMSTQVEIWVAPVM
jgi:hypothetical protein